MTIVAICFFIFACGWNFYRDYTPTRTKALRNEGHPQYFGAALGAAYVFLLAISVHQAAISRPEYVSAVRSVAAWSPREASEASVPSAPAPAQAPALDQFANLFAVAVWSAVFCVIGPFLLNIPYRFNATLTKAVTFGDLEELERMAVHALSENLTLLLTLSSNKVYAGFPIETSQDGSAETKWILIEPLASGHRHKETGKLTFTTAYEKVYGEMAADESEQKGRSDFRVALPVDQISSVQLFDLDLYIRRFSNPISIEQPANEGAIAVGQSSSKSPVVSEETSRFESRRNRASNLRVLSWLYGASLTSAFLLLPISSQLSLAGLVTAGATGLALFKPTAVQLKNGSPVWLFIHWIRERLATFFRAMAAISARLGNHPTD